LKAFLDQQDISYFYYFTTKTRKGFYAALANEIISKLNSGRVLDIGTGSGNLPIEIAKRAPNLKIIGMTMRKIITICLPLPYKLGTVNCYLIETDTSYILIDTGCPNKRTKLEKELESAGCKPGNLNLIVLTHGDFDHTGNAAHLREKFGAKIVMHHDDSGMVERRNMFWNRRKRQYSPWNDGSHPV